MAGEDEKKRRKKKKKTRKDKWGQPIESPAEEVHVEEEESGGGDGGGGGGGEYDEASGEKKETSYETNKVVVSGMPYTTTEDQIRDLFQDIGSISHLQLSRFPDSGNFRGLAFVTFEGENIAASSLRLDGTKMGNRFLKVERCRVDSQKKRKCDFLHEPKKVDGCLSAYVGNLSWDVTEDDIRECFETSKIVSIRFAMDKNTETFRGFGHVDFEDDESLEEAMKKNQVELHGRPMKISYAVCKRN